jgi:hypothetical protein
LKLNITTVYISMGQAATALNIHKKKQFLIILKITNKTYKGRYIFQKNRLDFCLTKNPLILLGVGLMKILGYYSGNS